MFLFCGNVFSVAFVGFDFGFFGVAHIDDIGFYLVVSRVGICNELRHFVCEFRLYGAALLHEVYGVYFHLEIIAVLHYASKLDEAALIDECRKERISRNSFRIHTVVCLFCQIVDGLAVDIDEMHRVACAIVGETVGTKRSGIDKR